MKRLHTRLLSVVMAFVMAFSFNLTALAADENDKEEKEQQIEALEQEKEEQNQALDSMHTDKANTEVEIESLDNQLSSVQTEIDTTNSELEKTEAELEQTKKDLEAAQEKEKKQYETLKLRIKVMYKKGDTGYLEILLAAEDITSLLNSTEYISKISDYDSNLLQSLRDTRTQIEALEKQQEEEVARITQLKEELETQETELQGILDEKAAYIQSLNTTIEYTEEYIQELEENISMEQQALAEIEAEIRAAAAAAAAEAAAAAAAQEEAAASGDGESSGSSYVEDVSGAYKPSYGGGWVWPSDTTYLTDTFGYQDWRGGNHNGIDIGAGYGSPIYAAASGTVWIAGYSSSAGNWVVIDHGGGVLSVYMHASALYVSSGQYVSAGQSIAAVGSTGWSTGPHLHFGVMVGSSGGYDGYWVDPLGYVSP
ncbi:peptidoglycan DD-metalloendopeptidase family protein [Frisingicoccus caecimuris]|uniref:Septal ring factor EnvC (AmiA/AmiB activator) n=1 Tax=Frisingicoccus caecimuris TaxID=1796636 RepID=A0A4R2LSV4_9FIRM|nr:M23 family metallopeptidase [Frisingicoccus caecimuris]MCR1918936.1 peptidoglycan DD-metalloendopeptidase family protein [Frisingicoccus caecimuris]TCO82848.1 septal ring factor EnvC (AmiA/AmiB activator) [Frisingicoccus caecimuris]